MHTYDKEHAEQLIACHDSCMCRMLVLELVPEAGDVVVGCPLPYLMYADVH